MDELIGRTIAQYRLQRKIGQGSIAAVFEAQAADENLPVVVKIISHKEAETSPGINRRFTELAEKLVHLNHPNILAVTQFGIEADAAFLVMPLIEGGQTLRDRLRRGSLGSWRTIELLKQVAGALDYAHQQGVLHLDLKPSNVLVDPQNWSWVTDFGLAEALEEKQTEKRSAYLAPEQVLGEPVDQRSDIYALGVVMYEVLTGTLPYGAAPASNQLTVSPRDLNPDISESLAHVTLRALALKPADRYSSATDFLRALQIAADDDSYREPYVEGIGVSLAAATYDTQDTQPPTADHSITTPSATIRNPTSESEARKPGIIPLPKTKTAEQQEIDKEKLPAGAEPISPSDSASSAPSPVAEVSEGEPTPTDTEGDTLPSTSSEMTPAGVQVLSEGDDIQREDTNGPDTSEDESAVLPREESVAGPLITPVVVDADHPDTSGEEPAATPASEAEAAAAGETETGTSTEQETRKTSPSWPVPVWVAVLGLGFVLVLVVWWIFALTLRDSFSSVGATQTATAGAALPPVATDTPVTPSPMATGTPTNTPLPPTRTPLPPPPTATMSPTDTPLPPTETPIASLPSPTVTPSEDITPTLEIPAGQWLLISPAEGDPATNGLVQFEWEWSGDRLPDQGFEIKVWRPGQPPLGAHDAVVDNQTGLVKQIGETRYSIELDITNAQGVQGVTSRYLWTVALIQISPDYVELGEQAEPGTLKYLGFRGPEDIVDNLPKPVDNRPTSPQGTPENQAEVPVDNGDNSQPDEN